MVRIESTLSLALSLCLLAACDGEAESPKAGETKTEALKEAPAEPSPEKPAPAKSAPAPKIQAGMEAKQVVAFMGHPDQDFGGTEGEGCFGYADQPELTYCFSLKTEQATWAQVFGENYPVQEVRPRDPEETARAKPVKKTVLAQPDPPESGR